MTDYKLVPLEPTPEMMGAARNAPMPMILIDSIAGRQDLTNASVYRAMLAAAPDVQGKPVDYPPASECEQLRKDAERYRYLRKGNQWVVAATKTGFHLDGEELDDLLDSEMEQQT